MTKGQTTMRYMNDYDIARACMRYADHPVMLEAVKTVADLMDWTNHNSDGWAYWRPPVQAAAQLINLIAGNGTNEYERETLARDPEDLDAAYRRALRPIKAFRTKVTRTGASSASPERLLEVVYGTREPMPWFDITPEERAATAVKVKAAREAAQAAEVRELAARLAPALHEVTCPDCQCAALYGSADELAGQLAAIALEHVHPERVPAHS